MEEYGLPAPLFESDGGVFRATLYNRAAINNNFDTNEEAILDFCRTPRSRAELEQLFKGKMTIAYVMEKYIKPIVSEGLIGLTIPDKPKSKTTMPKAVMASEFDVLDGIPDKKRGMGAIICLIDRKLYLRDNLVALPLWYI